VKRLVACSALLAASPLFAATSRVAVTAGARDFLAGEAKGTAVSADGRLTLAPPLAPRAWPENAADAAVFAAAGDASGRVYLATGGGLGRLFVSDAKGVTLLFTAPEPNLTAVAVAADGAVVCASSPNGKVYRVNPKETDPAKAGAVLGDPKEAAIWALAFGPNGTLYAGTGNKGRIYRKTSSGALELFHEVEDVHVRSLLVGPDGTVYAGTSDRGLVVAIGPKGARTLHDFSRPEVTGLALDGKGVLYAAASQVDGSVGRAAPADGRPRPTPTPTPTPVAGEEVPKGNVSISATMSPARPASSAPSANNSEIVAIAPDGFVEPAWTFPEEAVFALRFDAASGSLLVATGPRGRLYAWKDRAVRLLAQTGEKLVVAAPAAGTAFAAVTNGAAGILRPAASPSPASFVSAVKDAVRLSTFGRVRWEGSAPAGSSVALSVRAGNSEKPDATWSPWAAAGAGGDANLPAARYFQWKADLAPNAKGESPAVERVELTYAERNARPVLENLAVLEPGVVFARAGSGGAGVLSVTNPDENGIFAGLDQPRESSPAEGPGRRLWRKGFRTLTWKGTDPNGDTLRYEVDARREGGPWFPVRKDVEESFLSFDTTALADGRYRFRVTATDRLSQPEGEALTAAEESALAVVDNTPPVLKVEAKKAEGDAVELRVLATDALSPVVRAEGSVNADRWRILPAEDGAADSPVERFVFRVPKPAGPSVLAVRVLDSAGNVATLSVEWPSGF
jgi:outer membrane protein assembly factor BamB